MKPALANIVVACIGVAGAVTGAYFTAQAGASTQIDATNARVDVVTEREANHYDALNDRLGRIEDKLDTALK